MKKASKRKYYVACVQAGPKGISAKFGSGVSSRSRDAVEFFTLMDDKGFSLDQVASYVHMGPMCDPFKDWTEIRRVLASFPVDWNGAKEGAR